MRYRSAVAILNEYHPGHKISGSIKLSSNENPLGTSPMAVQAMKSVIEDVSIYPPVHSQELTNLIAQRNGLDDNQVILGNGSDEIFSLCAGIMIEPGVNAVSSEHVFSQYQFSTSLFGGEFRSAAMKDLNFDLDAMLKLVDENTRIVFLCSPNNPTGRCIAPEDLQSFLKNISSDIMVVIDQAYIDFADSAQIPDTAEFLRRFSNLVFTRTFSKMYGLAALRIGYGLASPDLIQTLLKAKSPFNTNQVALNAAMAAYQDEAFVKRTLYLNEQGKKEFGKALDVAGISYLPTQANFFCVKSPTGKASDAVEALQKEQITVRDLTSFGLSEYCRITVTEAHIMKKIASILGNI